MAQESAHQTRSAVLFTYVNRSTGEQQVAASAEEIHEVAVANTGTSDRWVTLRHSDDPLDWKVLAGGIGIGDHPLSSIYRAFESAGHRFCCASSFDLQRDELSNQLHHLYRLAEVTRAARGERIQDLLDVLYSGDVSDQRACAALWARGFDTHEQPLTVVIGDHFLQSYTDLYGNLAWCDFDDLPAGREKAKHSEDHAYRSTLAGHPVIDTLGEAFTALMRLASAPD